MKLNVLVTTDLEDTALLQSVLRTVRDLPRTLQVVIGVALPFEPGAHEVRQVQALMERESSFDLGGLELMGFEEAAGRPWQIALVSCEDRTEVARGLAELSETLLALAMGRKAPVPLPALDSADVGERLTKYEPIPRYRRPATASVISRPVVGGGHIDNELCQISNVVVDDTRVAVGRFTYCNGPITFRLWQDWERIEIGAFCSIATGVKIFGGGNHRTSFVSTYPFHMAFGDPVRRRDGQPYGKGPTVIGNDVWVGEGAQILSGVTVGHGAVVGAAAVVASDVPPYAVVAGNPAKLVRYRFEKDVIDRLLNIAWWEWPIERIYEASHMLAGPMVSEFVSLVDEGNLSSSETLPRQTVGK